mmetsp:Transcript_40101/g.63427  ORF Transcript_40101/g.63427 Transcript_40101/m.63427 type:complete len:493 (-) Transcript_40101:61-1539(-)
MTDSRLKHLSNLPRRPDAVLPRRATKIVCTVGPSTQSVESLKALISSGMNVIRMNFSHGTHDYHKTTVENARKAAIEMNSSVAIALDTKGPEIRTGLIPEGEIKFSLGQELYVTTNEEWKNCGNAECFYMDYPHLSSIMGPGDRIYIDDGLLGLDVVSVEGDRLRVKVAIPSTISSNKGCNLPGKRVELPAVSEKDKKDLQWAREIGVDIVFASFIRSCEQVEEVRSIVGPDILIFSKIENQQGLDNIDSIIEKSDGIMIARGDLGVEIPPENLLLAQKMITAKCNLAGKPVICATQMLDSMTKNPRPTRAEISDVGNAVMDGVDCVMLSGETAKGMFPEVSVDVMARISANAELGVMHQHRLNEMLSAQPSAVSQDEAIVRSAVLTSLESKVKGIVLISKDMHIAQLVSKYRPSCPILFITPNPYLARKLSILRSVEPICCLQEAFYNETSIERIRALLNKEALYLTAGDSLLLLEDARESGRGEIMLFPL